MSDNVISVFSTDDAIKRPRLDRTRPAAVDLDVQMADSSPIQGQFGLGLDGEMMLRHLEPGDRSRLGSHFLELQSMGSLPRQIPVELIEEAIARPPMPVIERAGRLLRFLHDETTQIGQGLSFGHDDHRPLLHSESIDVSEIRYLLRFLEEQGLVNYNPTMGNHRVTLTVPGFAQIAEQRQTPDSSQAFVAMWFHDSMETLYEQGIRPAADDAGYEALRVDLQPTLHRIDDQIIAEIRRSRFLIADFTHDDRGARGSVYYEAGFAHGLGLPVIFTCRQDQLDKLHFDTRQYPHIGWTEPADLREPLRHRIEAVIGRGPRSAAQG